MGSQYVIILVGVIALTLAIWMVWNTAVLAACCSMVLLGVNPPPFAAYKILHSDKTILK
jgi:hypothetical protein